MPVSIPAAAYQRRPTSRRSHAARSDRPSCDCKRHTVANTRPGWSGAPQEVRNFARLAVLGVILTDGDWVLAPGESGPGFPSCGERFRRTASQ